jgi:hypothetical protein
MKYVPMLIHCSHIWESPGDPDFPFMAALLRGKLTV